MVDHLLLALKSGDLLGSGRILGKFVGESLGQVVRDGLGNPWALSGHNWNLLCIAWPSIYLVYEQKRAPQPKPRGP